jgi:hypothetical protein
VQRSRLAEAFFGAFLQEYHSRSFSSRKPAHMRSLSSRLLVPFLTMGAGLGANPLGRPPSPRGSDNCSGDHFRRMRSWRHSSEALNRLLRGSLRFVSIRFQDNAALDGAAVAALKNKPAPDNPPLAWIFSKPIAIVAPWMCH